MAKIEIEESEFHDNQKLKETVGKMLKHPDARRLVLQAQKTIDPNANIPEIDAAKPVLDAVGAIQKEFADFRKEITDQRTKDEHDNRLTALKDRMEAGRSRLRQMGVTDEGLKGVEALMEERGIIDHDIAWTYFEKMNPSPTPVETAGHMFNLFEAPGDNADENMKKLLATKGEDDLTLNKMIAGALTDVRSVKAR